ncbi:recombinase family protein [Peptoanaerobacter stomatis]|uniref:recombinase family protein n=1 Tax=Peptoanaerobacter stomatis TaxID=796937 RepID=UPI0009083273|nr:recombinase family protein [Peptoanaerobacter stomatis]
MNVVAYARFSSDNQREESIDAQVRAIKKYCNDNNYTLIRIYSDEAYSAKTDKRPQFLQMLKDSKSQQFSAVIVHKFDRFARNRFDSVKYKYELKQQGIKVYSVLEHLSDTPESVLMESLYEGMAEYYSLNLGREVMKGMMENAEKGLFTGGIPPLGFDIINKKYTINEYEAEAVRIIYSMYINDFSYTKILNTLNNKGYKTKKGKVFGKNSLHEILKNEKYIGNYVYNLRQSEMNGKRNNHSIKSEDEIVRKEGILPAIIDREVWDKVRAKMDGKKRNNGKNKAIEKYLLSGKIYCECGAKMHGNRRGNGNTKGYIYTSYNCSNKCGNKGIEKNKIENFVLEHLKDYFTDDIKEELFETMKNKFFENKTKASYKIKIYEKELRIVQKQIDNIVQAVADGLYNSSMKDKMNELESKKIELNSLIEKAQFYTLPSFEQFNQYLNLILKFDNETNNQRIIDTFIDKVIVSKDYIKLNIKIHTGIKSVDINGAEEGT